MDAAPRALNAPVESGPSLAFQAWLEGYRKRLEESCRVQPQQIEEPRPIPASTSSEHWKHRLTR